MAERNEAMKTLLLLTRLGDRAPNLDIGVERAVAGPDRVILTAYTRRAHMHLRRLR